MVGIINMRKISFSTFRLYHKMLKLVFLAGLIAAQRSFLQPIATKFRFENENSRDQSLPVLAFNRTSSFFVPVEVDDQPNLLVYDTDSKDFHIYEYRGSTFKSAGKMSPIGGDITTDCQAAAMGSNLSFVCRLNKD